MYHQQRSLPPSGATGAPLPPPTAAPGAGGPPPPGGPTGPPAAPPAQPNSTPLGGSLQPQMMPQQHGSNRLADLMAELKAEFDVLAHENNNLKSWRDESEHKFEQQIQEVGNLKKYLEQLDHMQRATKEAYDREIRLLNHQLESRGHAGPAGPTGAVPVGPTPQQPSQQPGGTPQQGASRGFSDQGMPPTGYPGQDHRMGQGGPAQAGMQPSGYMNGSSGGAPVADTHVVKRIRGEDGGPIPAGREGYGSQSYPVAPPTQVPTPPPGQSKRQGKHNMDEVGARGMPPSAQFGGQGPPQPQQGYRGQPSEMAGRPGAGGPAGVAPYGHVPPGGVPVGPPQSSQQIAQQQPLAAARDAVVTGINDLDPKTLPAGFKVDRKAWSSYFNPASPVVRSARLNVELTCNFDHQSVVCCVKFSNDGKFLATGSNHSTHIFDVSTKQSVCILADESASKEQDLYIRSVVFSPDNQYLATGAEDRLVRIWHIPTRTIRHALVGHDSDIYSLDWSRDGRVVASGSGDWSVKIWDPETGRCLMNLTNDADPTILGETAHLVAQREKGITSVAFRPNDGRTLVCGSLDHMIRVWDLRTGQLLERFEGHTHSVYSVAFSPNGESIVSGSLDKMVMVWDLSSPTLEYLSKVDRFEAPTPEKREPPKDPSALVPGVGTGTVVPSPKPYVNVHFRQRFRGHADYVLSVACAGNLTGPQGEGHPELGDFEWVVSGSKDRRVTFWDARNGKGVIYPPEERYGPGDDPRAAPIFVLQGHKNSVISITLAPVGGLFATGSGDYAARVWKITTDRGPVPLLPGGGVSELENSPQKSSLAQPPSGQPGNSPSPAAPNTVSPQNAVPPASAGAPIPSANPPTALAAHNAPLSLPEQRHYSATPGMEAENGDSANGHGVAEGDPAKATGRESPRASSAGSVQVPAGSVAVEGSGSGEVGGARESEDGGSEDDEQDKMEE